MFARSSFLTSTLNIAQGDRSPHPSVSSPPSYPTASLRSATLSSGDPARLHYRRLPSPTSGHPGLPHPRPPPQRTRPAARRTHAPGPSPIPPLATTGRLDAGRARCHVGRPCVSGPFVSGRDADGRDEAEGRGPRAEARISGLCRSARSFVYVVRCAINERLGLGSGLGSERSMLPTAHRRRRQCSWSLPSSARHPVPLRRAALCLPLLLHVPIALASPFTSSIRELVLPTPPTSALDADPRSTAACARPSATSATLTRRPSRHVRDAAASSATASSSQV